MVPGTRSRRVEVKRDSADSFRKPPILRRIFLLVRRRAASVRSRSGHSVTVQHLVSFP